MIATTFAAALLTKQGIHGLPRMPWNNVNVEQKMADGKGFAGYCAHSTATFSTWHRPYLALLEVGG